MVIKIAVDGSNLCAVDSAPKSTFRLDRLVYAVQQLRMAAPNAELKVFVDANLRWKLSANEKDELESRIRNAELTQVPAGITADDYILEWANRNSALVVSNDQFKQYHTRYQWLPERGAGRSITAIFDQSDRTWTFMERNAGSGPARQIGEIVKNYLPTPVVVDVPTVKVDPIATPTKSAYTKRISRRDPTAFVVMVDQSGSMGESWQNDLSKADQVATIVNNALRNLVIQATAADQVRDYADVAVIGYGGMGVDGVRSLLPGTSVDNPFVALSNVAKLPKVSIVENLDGSKRREVTWFESVASGGTPMNRALSVVRNALEFWVNNHQESFPPVVINITDGEASDADPSSVARDVTGLETSEGNVLLFTAFIGTGGGKQSLYPSELPGGMSKAAVEMFEISSVVPEPLRDTAEGLGIHIRPSSRGFMFNASRDEVAGLVNFGTSVRTPDARN